MKYFRRVDPTTVQKFGQQFQRHAVVKHFTTEDGVLHEFTTYNQENSQSVCVIALTADRQVLIAYQFRAGPEKHMFDLPGGDVEPGEKPADAALRELREETGYTTDTLKFIGVAYRSAYTNMATHCFLAEKCYHTSEGLHLDHEEESQGLEVRHISIGELIQNAKQGRTTDASAVLMAYDRLKELENGPTTK